MDLKKITLEKFVERFTYSSDPNPEEKIMMSNGVFAQCVITFQLINQLRRLANK